MDKIALIVAGGKGTRMKSDVPKQFLTVGNLPVLMHTIGVFYSYDSAIRIIVVLPEYEKLLWQKLCRKYSFAITHEVKSGGKTRFHSVQKNLRDIPPHSLIAVHDGVRPLVKADTIARCFETAKNLGNAVPYIEVPETLRKIGTSGSKQVNRKDYCLIQTPQVFEGTMLIKAYSQEYDERFTDDAGVVESMGFPIHLIEGDPENIKITYEKDLIITNALLKSI